MERHLAGDNALEWQSIQIPAANGALHCSHPLMAYWRKDYAPAHGNGSVDGLVTATAICDALAKENRLPAEADLLSLQHLMTGTVSGFRQGPAFGRKGLHRYGGPKHSGPLYLSRFHGNLNSDQHPLIQAVRIYLDTIFIHPFTDGNGRAAMLWFYFCLRRAGLAVPRARTVRLWRKRPGDQENYRALVAMLARRLYVMEGSQ